MTKEEALKIIEFKLGRGKEAERLGFHNGGVYSWRGRISEEREALEMAISALSENKGDLISRQAVLDEMDKRHAEGDCITKGFIKALPSVENKGEWVPVSERLPALVFRYKISDDVLITDGYEIYMGYLVERNGKIFWHYYGSDYEFGIKDENNDAIAWMPLPTPYKERGE